METREKIARWLTENGITQSDLAQKADVNSGKMSVLLSGKQGPTIRVVEPLSRAMNVSLDWLYDNDAQWPPLPRYGRGIVLSDAQAEVLKLAARVSKHDPNPEMMETALDLLVGLAPKQGKNGHQTE